VQEIAKHCR